jgi:hypothetical protein
LIAAAVLGMLSYISVSVNLPEKQIVISFDRKAARRKQTALPSASRPSGEVLSKA